jgi:hypothetical protein
MSITKQKKSVKSSFHSPSFNAVSSFLAKVFVQLLVQFVDAQLFLLAAAGSTATAGAAAPRRSATAGAASSAGSSSRSATGPSWNRDEENQYSHVTMNENGLKIGLGIKDRDGTRRVVSDFGLHG